MKRTIVYIDGYNLYYRLLRGTGDKWLDLHAFAKGLLNDEHDILEVKYFTSMVVPFPYDADAIERQNVYLQALAANPKISIVLGFYSKKPAILPARSKSADHALNRRVAFFVCSSLRKSVRMSIWRCRLCAMQREMRPIRLCW